MTERHGLRMIWSSLAVSRYYPLTLTSFWVQRRLWGLKPMPYHQVNIALHGINGSLVFLMLRRLRIPGAWLAAMLWVLHPVNVESVAWITELKNTQSGLFFFLRAAVFSAIRGGGPVPMVWAGATVCGGRRPEQAIDCRAAVGTVIVYLVGARTLALAGHRANIAVLCAVVDAIGHYEEALRIQPDLIDAQKDLARLRAVR